MKRVLVGVIAGAILIGAAAACFAQTAERPAPGREPASDTPSEARFVAGGTDVGVVRDHNEDSYGIFRSAGYYLVADGMGGHAAGEVASSLAVEWIGKYVKMPFHNYFRMKWPDMARIWIQQAYDEAHRQIYMRAQANGSERGMGTTAVSLLTTPTGVWIINLGDSRAYRIRNHEILQLSHDHSLVQQLIDDGSLRTQEEIARFPYKNIITRVMGTEGDHRNETFYDKPEANDVYVLCSDGLTNEVSESEIVQVVDEYGLDLEGAVQKLIRMARDHGGRDNITVVLVMM